MWAQTTLKSLFAVSGPPEKTTPIRSGSAAGQQRQLNSASHDANEDADTSACRLRPSLSVFVLYMSSRARDGVEMAQTGVGFGVFAASDPGDSCEHGGAEEAKGLMHAHRKIFLGSPSGASLYHVAQVNAGLADGNPPENDTRQDFAIK